MKNVSDINLVAAINDGIWGVPGDAARKIAPPLAYMTELPPTTAVDDGAPPGAMRRREPSEEKEEQKKQDLH